MTGKAIVIKSLDEILAEMSAPANKPTAPVSAKSVSAHKADPAKSPTRTNKAPAQIQTQASPQISALVSSPKSNANQAAPKPTPNRNKKNTAAARHTHIHKPSDASRLINSLTGADDAQLSALKQTDSEPLYHNDQATNRLRWLAFYYLSRRELSSHELKKKLIDKDCEPTAVALLLDEFAQKGYQSDERAALMHIREAVRKNRGIYHLRHSLKEARIDIDALGGLDALMAQTGASLTDGTVLENSADGDTDGQIDWLRLAVDARSRKYGSTPPTTPKEKARQLRFLQYRGFDYAVCLEALKLTPEDFDNEL